MKLALHQGFRSAQKAISTRINTAQPSFPANPAIPRPGSPDLGSAEGVSNSPKGRRAKSLKPFGGKAAPPFQKKDYKL